MLTNVNIYVMNVCYSVYEYYMDKYLLNKYLYSVTEVT